MNNLKKAWTVAKVNFRYTTWIAYLVTAIVVLAGASNYILAQCLKDQRTSVGINYLYMLCILAPIFIASMNYTKLMHIGVKKRTYLHGCIINYLVFASVISVIETVKYFALDINMDTARTPVYNLINIFGWDDNIFTAFFCQFAFLMLAQVAFHTLTFIQTKWYGIVTDVVIITIISVFTPIAVLRQAEVFFFYLIIFMKPAIAQIAICLALSLVILLSNRFFLSRRNA